MNNEGVNTEPTPAECLLNDQHHAANGGTKLTNKPGYETGSPQINGRQRIKIDSKTI